MPEPRMLTLADVPGAMALKEAAGWNQVEADWRRVIALPDAAVFGIDCEGRLAATASGVCYGNRLAWIGMVLTHPDFRGRGFARALMRHTLEWIEARNVDWIKLDATDMGRPLYAGLGFEDECVVERWGRPADAAPVAARDLPAVALERFSALDSAAFGVARRELLAGLAVEASAQVEDAGYAMGREGSKAAYFGPAVARDAATARTLLEWWLGGRPRRGVFWDILAPNAAAVDLAREYGFAPLRRLTRMARPGRSNPPALGHGDDRVFAIAGFEFG